VTVAGTLELVTLQRGVVTPLAGHVAASLGAPAGRGPRPPQAPGRRGAPPAGPQRGAARQRSRVRPCAR